MNATEDDYVREKTHRIVGREALKRASRMVRDWQKEELENSQLAKRITIGLALAALAGAALFILF